MANWLSKYEQGGMVLKQKTKDNYGKQGNYNDAKVSTPPGYVGMGYDTKGRDYSPAWGGQFQDGGIIVNDSKDPRLKAYQDSLTAYNKSNDLYKQLLKQGKEGNQGIKEQVKDKMSLKEVDYRGSVGMPYSFEGIKPDYVLGTRTPEENRGYLPHYKKPIQLVEYQAPKAEVKKVKGSKKYFINETQVDESTFNQIVPKKEMAMGGGIPGAVGFTYARVAGSAPANGKYTKKTKASAQNGMEMKFYQEGLDFKPKTISKNGSKVIKDNRGQWAHPGEVTEIGSNNITMQGVEYPVLGVSDTGDTQMMQPGQDYKFDGEKVTEYPMMQEGGWLNKYQEGGTLMKDKKVGENITPITKLDLRPTIYNYKRTEKEVYDPNCPDGVGCSKQATDVAQSITGLPREAYAPADAGYRDAVAKRTGLINIFDQEGYEKTHANSNDAAWKYPTNDDFSKWKAGDIVTLDAGNDIYFGYSAPKGYTRSDNSSVSHNGVVTGFTEEGRPIITHGYATGKNKGKSITEVLNKDNRVTDLGHGRYAVKSVWRPKEIDSSGQVSSIKNVIDTGEERAGRKQATTSNSSFYLKPTKEEKLQKDYPVGAEFSGANTRLQTKNKLVNLFNDEKLDKDLQYKLGITAQELDKLKPVVYGVFGQESNFNDIDNAGASFKEIIGNLFGNNSRGAAQIKMSSLTDDEKKILGVKKAKDLDNDEVAYKAALLMLNNSRKRMNQEVEEGTHPELADKDEYFRAGYYYNSPARAIQSSKDWVNKKSGRTDLATIAKNELRMDEGSYPYKLMERAKDLGVNVNFDATSELEPVVVRSAAKNNKGTKFVPTEKTNGGWLNKYK